MAGHFPILTLLLVLLADPVLAESPEPLDAVTTFFDAMSTNDANLAASVMIEDGVIYGYVETSEGFRLIRTTTEQFLEGMRNRSDAALERIWDVKVLVHDRLAIAWTPYDFFLNGEFHHCGVNNFNLIRTDDGWKIAGVTYSIEVESCEESPLGAPEFE